MAKYNPIPDIPSSTIQNNFDKTIETAPPEKISKTKSIGIQVNVPNQGKFV